MKKIVLCLALSISFIAYGQQNDTISTIDFVQVVGNNYEETIFYYDNNWKVLREMAIKKSYIHSYQLLEVPHSPEAPFHIMLITTYANAQQYAKSEDHFSELIREKGPLRLMNEKKPGDFRKILFSKEMVRHRN